MDIKMKNTTNFILLTVISLIVLLVLFALTDLNILIQQERPWREGDGPYENLPDYSTKAGIDISHHQDLSIWNYFDGDTLNISHAMNMSKGRGVQRRTRITFVYIKASQGGGFKDPLCVEHFKKAKEHGIPAGFYHFYLMYVSPEKQFRNFKEQMDKVKTDLPPALDFEHIAEHVKTDSQKKKVWKDFMVFYNLVKKEYKVEPIIYINDGDYRMFFKGYNSFKGKNGFKLWYPSITADDKNQVIMQQPFIVLGGKIKIDYNLWVIR